MLIITYIEFLNHFTSIKKIKLDVVAYTFNPCIQEAEAADLCKFMANLAYKVSSRNPLSKNKKSYRVQYISF